LTVSFFSIAIDNSDDWCWTYWLTFSKIVSKGSNITIYHCINSLSFCISRETSVFAVIVLVSCCLRLGINVNCAQLLIKGVCLKSWDERATFFASDSLHLWTIWWIICLLWTSVYLNRSVYLRDLIVSVIWRSIVWTNRFLNQIILVWWWNNICSMKLRSIRLPRRDVDLLFSLWRSQINLLILHACREVPLLTIYFYFFRVLIKVLSCLIK